MGSGPHLSPKGAERFERVASVSETRDFMDTRLFLDSNFVGWSWQEDRNVPRASPLLAAELPCAGDSTAPLYLLLSLTQHVPLRPLVDAFMIGRALCRLTGLWEIEAKSYNKPPVGASLASLY